jgi:hypothetical protein
VPPSNKRGSEKVKVADKKKVEKPTSVWPCQDPDTIEETRRKMSRGLARGERLQTSRQALAQCVKIGLSIVLGTSAVCLRPCRQYWAAMLPLCVPRSMSARSRKLEKKRISRDCSWLRLFFCFRKFPYAIDDNATPATFQVAFFPQKPDRIETQIKW